MGGCIWRGSLCCGCFGGQPVSSSLLLGLLCCQHCGRLGLGCGLLCGGSLGSGLLGRALAGAFFGLFGHLAGFFLGFAGAAFHFVQAGI